jgi:hypothetical protein
LENLYALFRSLMILGIIVVGVVSNSIKVLDYLISGTGSEPESCGRVHRRCRTHLCRPQIEP